jgi:hypothetical protein
MNALLQPSFRGQAGFAIRSHAFLETPLSGVAALRDAASPPAAPVLPTRFLRHADEHTVVAIRAVLAAVAALPRPVSFDTSGVVAAPCQAGRIAAARSLALLRTGGAVTVSAHLAPQCCLHSLAGAVSVALGMHGPHIGVGGGPGALAEGLFAAMSLFQPGSASGCDAVWLIITEWAAEPVLDATGAAIGDPVCRALAMLLAPAAIADEARVDVSLHVHVADSSTMPDDGKESDLAALARAIEMCATGTALTSWTVTSPWGIQFRVAAREPAAVPVIRRQVSTPDRVLTWEAA